MHYLSGNEGIAVIVWLFAVETLAIIAFPLTTIVFRRLPDKGYAVSKVVGILLPSYIVWLLVTLNLFQYSRELIVAVIASLCCIALILFLTCYRFFTEIFRTSRKIFLMYEGVFLLAFAAFLLFRAYNPDIFWSESSMDFSFVNVLVRTRTFPPPDPWISGYSLNYYYFGHYLVAMLTRLTGILPQMTYNLAFALFPALVIVEAFSLLYNLTKHYLCGTLGVLFSSIIGNLDGFFLQADVWRGKEPYYRFFRPAHEVISHTVHEFPIWTFIFVDLHAHLLNMPFLLAAFLIGLNLLFSFAKGREGKPGRVLLMSAETLVYVLIIGTLSVISSWDYPTAVIFLLLIALASAYRNISHVDSSWLSVFRSLGYVVAILIPGSLILYLPFLESFSRKGMGIGIVGRATTQLPEFLTMFGFFFFVILSFFIGRVSYFRSEKETFWQIAAYFLLFLILAYAMILKLVTVNYATLFFVIFTMFFSSSIFLKTENTENHFRQIPLERLFIWLCLVYACMILAGCEIIFVRDFLQGGEWKRMNTIFKFYIPAWFLLSFVAAYTLFQLWRQHEQPAPKHLPPFVHWTWSVCFGALFVFSFMFPIKAMYARRHKQDVYSRIYLPPTLDGLAYIKALNPDEYEAIRWLNEHVSGTSVILEAADYIDYRYEYARISANTGLPTVLGWGSHVEQREHWGEGGRRAADVKAMYTSPDIQAVLRLLKYYQVEYIYVGSTEIRDFGGEGLKKFPEHPEYFEPVFHSGRTAIYKVIGSS